MDRDLRAAFDAAASGDEVAFGRLVATYHEDMRRVCAYVTRDPAMADDAVQLAWTTAWRKLDTVRDPDRLKPWLMRVAINEAKGLMRRGRRRTEVEVALDATGEPGGVDPATGVDAFDLRVALDRLDADDRALLALRYGAGFNATELAGAMGLSPSGTRTRLERLIKRLRKELTDG